MLLLFFIKMIEHIFILLFLAIVALWICYGICRLILKIQGKDPEKD